MGSGIGKKNGIIYNDLTISETNPEQDSSTQNLINLYKQYNK